MRKTIIPAALALALSCTATTIFSTSAIAADVEGPELNWNFSAWGKRRAFTEGTEALIAHVSEKTGGKFTIKLHYGGALSKPRENLDGISFGAFEMAMFCASYHPDKNRAATVLELPMLPVPSGEVQKAIDLAVYSHPHTQKEMAQWNAKILMSAALPQYEFMGRGTPPRKLEDFKGMRVRALGGIGEAMKVLGAVPTTVTAPETYQAIESGTVDAAAFAFYSHFSYRINEVSTWRTTNLAPGSVNCPTVVNIDAYNSLPAQYKTLLDEAVEAGYAALNTSYQAAIDKYTPVADAAGMEKISYSADELEAFRQQAAQPVWKAWVEKQTAAGVPAQELLDLVLKTAAEATQ